MPQYIIRQRIWFRIYGQAHSRPRLASLVTSFLSRTSCGVYKIDMTAQSMGAFGAYKYAYSKYLQEREARRPEGPPETVWVTKRYIPTDLRVTAPVPRHKLVATKDLPPPDPHWIPASEPPLRSFDRGQEPGLFSSHPSTRCEEYSTLRQMLPSRGSYVKMQPDNWGTGGILPVYFAEKTNKRLPAINSPMTRYVDDMHKTNKLFKLH